MSQKNDQISEKILSDLLMNFDKKTTAEQAPEKSPESKPTKPKAQAQQPDQKTAVDKAPDAPSAKEQQRAPKKGEPKKNVPKKKASKKAAELASDLNKEPDVQLEENVKIREELPKAEEPAGPADDDFFFDILSFSRESKKEPFGEQINIDTMPSSPAAEPSETELPPMDEEAPSPDIKEAGKNEKKKNKKKSFNLVEMGVKISERNEHAKLIFVLSMILLLVPALAIALAVLILFAVAAAITLLALGAMSIAVLVVVTVGVVLSMVGSAYGAINLLTGEGFAAVVGQYELGLGIAIAGVTIIVSALLYSGVTDLVPYIFKKTGQLFKFLVKKVKKLIVWLYEYSTQL